MPVTPATQALATDLRRTVGGDVDEVTRQLVALWVNSWDQLYGVWYAPVAGLMDGPRGRLATYQAMAVASASTGEELRRLTARIPQIAQRAVSDAAAAAANAQPELIRSQLPETSLMPAAGALVLAAGITPAPPSTIAAVAAATLAWITRELGSLDTGVTSGMRRVVVQGPHRGITDPERRTHDVMRRLETVYNRSLTKALGVTRTAVVDAARDASKAVQDANRRILVGWRWMARRDASTCPLCLSMDGREFPSRVPGPRSHWNCRCVRMPVVKPWRALGIAVPEPADATRDTQAWFWAQPEETQLRIMGPTRLARLRSGDLAWADIGRKVRKRRTTYQTRPLSA